MSNIKDLKCQFCHTVANYSGLGSLSTILIPNVGECAYHKPCLVWSEEMLSEPVDRPNCIKNAIKRAMRTKCFCCKSLGASIKCAVEGCSKQYHYPCAIQEASVFQTNPPKHFCKEHRSECEDGVLNPEGMTVNVTSTTFLETMSSKPLPITPEQNHHDNVPFPSIPDIYPLSNPQTSLVKEYEAKLSNDSSIEVIGEEEYAEIEEEVKKKKEKSSNDNDNNVNNDSDGFKNNNIPKKTLFPTPFSLSSSNPLIEIRKLSEGGSDSNSDTFSDKHNNKDKENELKDNLISVFSPPLSTPPLNSKVNNNNNNNKENDNNTTNTLTIKTTQTKQNKLSSPSPSVKQNESNKTDSSITSSKRGSKRKSDTESPPYKNMKLFTLENRDFIRVKIVKSLNTLSKGYIISLFGAQSFFDCLRTSHSTELSIDYGIDVEQFKSIYENAKLCNISVMKMILDDYTEETPVYKILNSMGKTNTVGYIERDLYEIFIIPNGQSLPNCGTFAASMERFSRNGETIAAWCLLVNKLR